MSDLKQAYQERFDVLTSIAKGIEGLLHEYLEREPRIDRISARPKGVDKFIAKASATDDGKLKYDDPLNQIQDQVGARVITFYVSDIERVVGVTKKYFHPIESKILVPDHQWKFGYFGRHFILLVPTDVVDKDWDKRLVPKFFELQVRTLFQHAWSEANHDLGYKPATSAIKPESERKLAYTAAQAWGADMMFDELYRAENH